MKRIKKWVASLVETPEKARTTLSNIAMGGGVLGFLLIVLAMISEKSS